MIIPLPYIESELIENNEYREHRTQIGVSDF